MYVNQQLKLPNAELGKMLCTHADICEQGWIFGVV